MKPVVIDPMTLPVTIGPETETKGPFEGVSAKFSGDREIAFLWNGLGAFGIEFSRPANEDAQIEFAEHKPSNHKLSENGKYWETSLWLSREAVVMLKSLLNTIDLDNLPALLEKVEAR